MKPTNACKHLKSITYYKHSKCHTLWLQLWPSSEMCHTKDILEKCKEPVHRCKILSFKVFGTKYMLKYEIDKFCIIDGDFNVVGC